MSTISGLPTVKDCPVPSAAVFAGVVLVVASGTAILVGWAPAPFAFLSFFLLAGPHSWAELRYYFLVRMPSRWGSLRGYYTVALSGVSLLSVGALLLEWLARTISAESFLTCLTIWNAALVLWVLALVEMRRRQSPRRHWPWRMPLALGLLLINWLTPLGFSVGVVYAHPLMALWILDRELLRRRPEWRRAYHFCLCCLPILLAGLWWHLAYQPPLGTDDRYLIAGIAGNAADLVPQVPTRFLGAALVFLSVLHYCVWVFAFPLLRQKAPWRLHRLPLAWRSPGWRLGVASLLAVGAVGVLGLWGCLLADFQLASEIYMLASIASVLAEAPFLLRTL